MTIIFAVLNARTLFLSAASDFPTTLKQIFDHALFAQTATADLKAKLGEVLTMIMLFGFLYGTIRIIGGAGQIRRGELEEGKASIVSGALIAAAPLIMRILFEVFFNNDGSIFGN